MLWNEGRVGGRQDSDEQWRKFTELLRVAKLGLDAALLEGESVETMIHIDRGGDAERSVAFFDRVIALGVEFDLIGLSYYPWWHGPLDGLATNLAALSDRFEKDVVVVETAYPWTLRWVDATQNAVGTMSELLRGYDATPAGQRRFLEDLVQIVAAVPGGRGRGVFYFAPERIAAGGPGSQWENVALFGERGEALPALRVLAPPIEEGR
jgi:arabinogalactan endo-1,4-beta-galactosidase